MLEINSYFAAVLLSLIACEKVTFDKLLFSAVQDKLLLAASNDFASRIWTPSDQRLRVIVIELLFIFLSVFNVLLNSHFNDFAFSLNCNIFAIFLSYYY